MRELVRHLLGHLPLEFRGLYRQFLLRVIDLEALSIEADVPRFIGQFAGLLIFVSLFWGIGLLWTPPPSALAWHMEQSAISAMLLVVGLIAVLTWDNIFPDRRDALVLGPLPINPRTILLAKVAASAALLGVAIVCLNFALSIPLSLVFAGSQGLGAILRFLTSYWFTIAACSIFLYGAVLTVQGLTAFLLPRRIFLRLSAILQLAAFGLFFSVYFLAPYIETPQDLAALRSHPTLAASPVCWFFALFNQCNGSLPDEGQWLADRAWTGLACAMVGAFGSLLVCYRHTMRKTVEEPDLVPAGKSVHWNLQLSSQLQSALFSFILRTLQRSRQHRVILAVFYAIVVACAFGLVRQAPTIGSTAPMSTGLMVMTVWMMVFAVLGFRAIAPLPVSLTANWALRITQLRPPEDYIAAVWRSIMVLAVVPVWIVSAVFSLSYRPFSQAAVHLILLLLLGLILVDLCLIGFHKVPFTCSYLPGKANFQYVF